MLREWWFQVNHRKSTYLQIFFNLSDIYIFFFKDAAWDNIIPPAAAKIGILVCNLEHPFQIQKHLLVLIHS